MKNGFKSAFFFIGLLLVGALGYVEIEGSTFLDGLYMTILTITTVGYGEVIPLSLPGKVFTMGLMLTGVCYVLFIFGRVTEAMVEGGLRKVFGRINMDKKLAGLNSHYIVCGFGRIGKVICESLLDNKKDFVVIENDPIELKTLARKGYLFVEGDSSDDEILEKSGIKKAKGLIAVVSSDADNVYITLSAKELNPDLMVMGRTSGREGADVKLLRAGADKVISPYYVGARQMANMILRPTVIDFLDLTVHYGELGLRLEELVVPPSAPFANMTLMESEVRKKYDLIVVAIKRDGEEMIFNPSHRTVIKPNDIIIVLGEYTNIKQLEKELS